MKIGTMIEFTPEDLDHSHYGDIGIILNIRRNLDMGKLYDIYWIIEGFTSPHGQCNSFDIKDIAVLVE